MTHVESPDVASSVLRLLREAAWAPVAVVVLRIICNGVGLRHALDWAAHFLGGLAMAYFLYTAVCLFVSRLGALKSCTVYLLAFCGTCAVAVFWEIGEFAGDRLFGTQSQFTLAETMGDLMYGVLGAAVALAIMRLKPSLHRKSVLSHGE
jgi:hypothetical protein